MDTGSAIIPQSRRLRDNVALEIYTFAQDVLVGVPLPPFRLHFASFGDLPVTFATLLAHVWFYLGPFLAPLWFRKNVFEPPKYAKLLHFATSTTHAGTNLHAPRPS